jgi:hypothetical protein
LFYRGLKTSKPVQSQGISPQHDLWPEIFTPATASQ